MIIKYIYIILILFLFPVSNLISQISNYKYWHVDSILNWSDFYTINNKQHSHSASSNCNISFYFNIINDTIVFEVKTYLDRNKSWKIKNIDSETLLKHEQIHFNIAELYARKLRKELMNFQLPDRSLTDTVKLIYHLNINAFKSAQNYFDSLTNSGMYYEAQTKFFNDLKKQMQQLYLYRKTQYLRTIN